MQGKERKKKKEYRFYRRKTLGPGQIKRAISKYNKEVLNYRLIQKCGEERGNGAGGKNGRYLE